MAVDGTVAQPRWAVRRPRRRRRALRAGRLLRVFLVVFAVLLAVRLALPFALRAYVNRVLDGLPGYVGRIGKLDLNLWRGAYEIEDLELQRARGEHPEPFLKAQRMDLSLTWDGLIAGKLVGEVVMHQPVVTFVAAESEAESQTGEGPSWIEELDSLFPFRIERFVIREGELRFESLIKDPPVDVYLNDFYLEAHNLTNIRPDRRRPDLPAEVEAAGRPLGTGEFEAHLFFDPLADRARFELDASLRKIDLRDLNDLLQAYGRVDAERGNFEMYTEFAASDGRVEGYVKTLFEDVELVSMDDIKSPGDALSAFWEGLVALGAELLENQSNDRIAAYVPLRGRAGALEADLMSIIASILRNAFVAALRPAIEDSIELKDLEVVPREGDRPEQEERHDA